METRKGILSGTKKRNINRKTGNTNESEQREIRKQIRNKETNN
jgi:hypothetical protein